MMNAFAPEGWIRTPKPVSRLSQAIQALSARLEVFDRPFGQRQLDSGGPFSGAGVHDASRFGRSPEGRCNPASTRAVRNPDGRRHGGTGVRGDRLNASLTL